MDHDLAIALLMEQIVRSAYRARKNRDIQQLQWSILRYLGGSPDTGRELLSISRYVGVTRAPTSRAVATLVGRGLVEKQRHTTDARTVSIKITSRGLEVLKDDPMVQIAHKLKGLRESDRDSFARLLRELVLSNDEEVLVSGAGSSG